MGAHGLVYPCAPVSFRVMPGSLGFARRSKPAQLFPGLHGTNLFMLTKRIASILCISSVWN